MIVGLIVKTSLTHLRFFSKQSPRNSGVCQKLPSIQNCSLNSTHIISVCLDSGKHFLLCPPSSPVFGTNFQPLLPFSHQLLALRHLSYATTQCFKGHPGIKTNLTCAEQSSQLSYQQNLLASSCLLFCVCVNGSLRK